LDNLTNSFGSFSTLALFLQDPVLLKTGANNPAALALLDFLKSAPALAIIQKFGYGLTR
jgi:hypothetical protein